MGSFRIFFIANKNVLSFLELKTFLPYFALEVSTYMLVKPFILEIFGAGMGILFFKKN